MSFDMGRSFEGLTREERLIRYRQFAEDALKQARRATNAELRAGFLTMANGWQTMATELERQIASACLAGASSDPAESDTETA